LFALFSCGTSSEKSGEQSHSLKTGLWMFSFDISDSSQQVQIPIRLIADEKGNLQFINAGEKIALTDIKWEADSFHFKFPLFQTFLSGTWLNDSTISGQILDPTRSEDYKIPFVARYSGAWKEDTCSPISKKYACVFSPNSEADRYKAVAVLNECGKKVTGTFMTETGDYRFLEGERNGNQLWLSCLDGAHLFYFTATYKDDSLVDGVFYSGKHWSEPFTGSKDQNAKLANPDSLTVISNGDPKEFEFTVISSQQDSTHFAEEKWKDKVSIIQLFGSWCPNCTDESRFFKELFEKYNSKGLQVIPVAFERGEDFEKNKRIVDQQFKEMGIPYAPYFGIGDGSGKARASATFPMLNHVMSFPTAIIIDKKGEVRKIHTGFYGPSTGDYYTQYTTEMYAFINQLLAE
jgi:thiol-disulfide isomerase/thioredoxin